ncbi:MogA/MoaB family molybdenum cofactor biosynthesis protein [Listeria aquatica]|uniref:Molybdenum cofactor biosynthesis protein B n=1 Tax=Listeria aquatica TaxID=1494960 RepID=A0A841ZIW2_9LIST|nr:MogA/MoaB family molybdenum cofactor biosynthesis protein [Listeria aquatica]MBC1520649.1 MogA/MoaB family molybdenum cofactor biosynthesis protein [Listeria aquatica]
MHDSNVLQVDCAILTISDTRTLETDASGMMIKELLEASGHPVLERVLVPDDADEIRLALKRLEEKQISCLISTGGTGISKRDVTFEALFQQIEQEIPGFGELFRMISYQEIGSKAMASRAFAGFTKRDSLFFALPGSKNAVQTGMQNLILPELPHLIAERRKQL